MKLYRFLVIIISTVSLGIEIHSVQIEATISPHNQAINTLISQAEQKQLHRQKKWHQLLHYKPTLLKTGVKSQIVSKNFFLAPNGNTDPNAELMATIQNYFTPTENQIKNHPQCQFPARYLWLKTQLEWPENSTLELKCPDYLEWSNLNQIENIEAVFVTGYFGNPASFYGHILLKIHTPILNTTNKLMDRSINFGAIVPPNENSVRFLIKGLMGGYKSTYTNQHFYQHNQYYAEKDLRDLWSYQLVLSTENQNLLVAHIWEVLGMDFKYYFFDRNCAYYMADLLQLVIAEPLLDYSLPWALPSSVFDHLTDPKNKKKLFTKIDYFPSRQTRFYSKYQSLSRPLKHIVQYIVNSSIRDHTFNISSPKYKKLSVQDKVKVIECLMDYNSFLKTKNKNDLALKQQKQQLLIARLHLKEKSPEWPSQPPIPPHFGQKPTRISLGTYHNQRWGLGGQLNFRAAYYDFLSISPGRPQHSSLQMFDLLIQQDNDTPRIETLTIVAIEKLGISTTGLTQDSSLSWNLNIGLKRSHLQKQSVDQLLIQAGIGKATKPHSSLVIYGMLDAQLIANHPLDSRLSPRISTIFTPKKWMAMQFTAAYRRQTYNNQTNHIVMTGETRLGFSRSMDLRMMVKRDFINEYRVGVSRYF